MHLFPAQITITSTDILNFIGSTEEKEADDTANAVIINIGNARANQSWNFSNVVMYQNMEEWSYLDPLNTPLANNFPSTAMFIKIIEKVTADTIYFLE
ncbi:hypothetical protein EH221_07380 [bacterium]|nr:MAG: hypothetical protein EH221_07380 [bacterium]